MADEQLMLFESDPSPVTALQTWHLAPPCGFGVPTLAGCSSAPGWIDPSSHCWRCYVDVKLACDRFDAMVAAGIYDAEGYTPAERCAQRRKHG